MRSVAKRGLAGEGVAEVHEVVGRRIDAPHGLEGGRVGDGNEDDEAGHRRRIESLRHSLHRQRSSELVSVPAGNEPGDGPARLAGDDDDRCLDVRPVGVFDERELAPRHFARSHLGRAHAVGPGGAPRRINRNQDERADSGEENSDR